MPRNVQISTVNSNLHVAHDRGMDPELNDKVIHEHLMWLRRTTDRHATHRHRRETLHRVGYALPVPLIEASGEHLDTWQTGLRVSASSVRTYTNHVRSFYRWARHVGHREDNPSENLPLPKTRRRQPRPIPEKDLRLAFACSHGDMTLWLALAGWCGLRAGEIARLRDDSVLDDHGTMLLHIDGKGGTERTVPVPDGVAPLIAGVRHRRGPLFTRPGGGPATPGYVSQSASLFFDRIGLPYTLHQLRHRFGTELYRISRDIRQVQELLGHASPATTAGYVAVAQHAAVKPLNKLGGSLPKQHAA